MKLKSKLLILWVGFGLTQSFGWVKEFEIPLMSYHIDNNATFVDAPLGIDPKSVFVFNPGFLFGLDSRKTTETTGFSVLGKAGFLQDCANKTMYIGIGGIRYRFKPFEKWAFDLNGYALVANAVTTFANGDFICPDGVDCTNLPSVDENERNTTFLPLINLGVNYYLKNKRTLGFTITFVPENTAIAATSGTHLLFLTASYAL